MVEENKLIEVIFHPAASYIQLKKIAQNIQCKKERN
jgi:hypothetical protein